MKYEITEEQIEFLNNLRESGETNMFGATPYIMEEFGVDRLEAKMILTAWIELWSNDEN